jgi:hypothetical protein
MSLVVSTGAENEAPAPTVNVPFSWEDPTAISLWMANDTIIAGIPNWMSFLGTGFAVWGLLRNAKPRGKR